MAKKSSVKTTRKTAAKNIDKVQKPKLSRIGFWLPLLYGTVNVFLLVFGVCIYSMGLDNIYHREIAELVLQAFQICLIFCPTGFIAMLYIYKKHSQKYANTPDWFRKFPGMFSIMVVVIEIAYLATLMIG